MWRKHYTRKCDVGNRNAGKFYVGKRNAEKRLWGKT